MRLRLGLLQDTAAIERQAAKEAAEAAAKKHKHEVPTVKTEAQTKADEKAAAKAAKEKAESKPAPRPRIRPLSEAKAIESGATFISEAFLFSVAAGLIFMESWRSRRKETSRRDDVAERLADLEDSERAARRALVELEREVLELRAKGGKPTTGPIRRILPREVWQLEEKEEKEDNAKAQGWQSRIVSYISSKDSDNTAKSATSAGPAETILAQSDAALAEKHRQPLEEASKSAESVGAAKKTSADGASHGIPPASEK
jgi:optic atrophy 3 protein